VRKNCINEDASRLFSRINPFASSTTPLTRLFNRGETVESRGCTAVAAFVSERKAGLGADFGVRFAKNLLVTYDLMTRVRSQFFFALVFLVC